MNLKNKIVVITGASRGLGGACAKMLTKKGAIVFGIARNASRLNALKEELGEKFIPVPVDITNERTITQWVKTTFSERFSPSVLINNAGVGHFAPIEVLSTEQWHNMINTNLTGAFIITKSILPFMRQTDCACHVINIGSILAKSTRSEASAYCATKHGLQGFSEALSKELRKERIKVTCINPGSIASDFFRHSGVEPHANMLQPEDIASFVACILETPDNFLVDEITIRPLVPTHPGREL